MKNHQVCNVYGDRFTGSTWCGGFVSRVDHEAPWTTESGKGITGHREECDSCKAATESDRRRAAAEEAGEKQSRHEVRREHGAGSGQTWCGRNVERGGAGRPRRFASGQDATRGVRACRVCEAAKAASRYRQPYGGRTER